MKRLIFVFGVMLALLCSCSDMSRKSDSHDPAKRALEESSFGAATTTKETAAVSEESMPENETTVMADSKEDVADTALFKTAHDLKLSPTDGEWGECYEFRYGEDVFSVIYTENNWKIINSYKIDNAQDMRIICQALIDIHPIPTADGTGERDTDSLVYEWQQHNLAYNMLPQNSKWIENVRDVDLNPNDESKSMLQMALDRLSE